MKLIHKLALGVAASAMMTGATMAADLIIVEPPPFYDTAVSDWDGVYAGLTGAAAYDGTVYPAIGVALGANFTSDSLLFGVEGELLYYFVGDFAGEVSVRAGALLTDSVLLYGTVGVGTVFNGGALDPYFPVGAGVEFLVSDSISLDLKGVYVFGGGGSSSRVSASLNFHF